MKTPIIAFLLGLVATCHAVNAADLSLTVSEGPGGAIRGVWHLKFDGSRVAGHAEMAGPSGRKITYQINGERNGAEYVLQRGNSSDGVACAYRGKSDGSARTSGTALCSTGASSWSALKK